MNKNKVSNNYLIIIIFLIATFILTAVLETYNRYYDNRTKNEIRNAIVLKDAKFNKNNNDKLIFINGVLDYNNKPIHDNLFDLYVNTPKLLRYVETYQWVEHIKTNEKGKKIYTYTKEWSSNIIDSTKFQNKEHKNPVKKYANNKLFTQKNIKVGELNVSKELYTEIYNKKIVRISKKMKLPKGFKINNVHITNSNDLNNPEIGDTRVIYFYSDWSEVTILAKQKDNYLKKYTTKNNEKLITIIEGHHSLNEIAKKYTSYMLK